MNFKIAKENNVYKIYINNNLVDIDDFGCVTKNTFNEYEFFCYSFNEEIARKYHINYLEYDIVIENIENTFNCFVAC